MQLRRRGEFLLRAIAGKIPSLLLTAPVCEATGNSKIEGSVTGIIISTSENNHGRSVKNFVSRSRNRSQ
jgi:hypothetical protein